MLSITSVELRRLPTPTVEKFNISDFRTEIGLSDGTILVEAGDFSQQFPVGPVENLDSYYRDFLKKNNAAFLFGGKRWERCSPGYAKETKRPSGHVRFDLEW